MKEREIIAALRDRHYPKSSHLIKGIGDDCAVFQNSGALHWLVTTDLLVENVHFSLQHHPPYLLGRKSLAVNLSDIAAMGATPCFVLSSLAFSPQISSEWLSEWQRGVTDMLEEFDCILIGGDTTCAEKLSISITAIGKSEPGNIVYRSGADADQDIYVTGLLGSSAAGLKLLRENLTEKEKEYYAELIDHHLSPYPQVEVGKELAKAQLATAMQDISDGIATDISHICQESGIGAILYQDMLPASSLTAQACSRFGWSCDELILCGGEDYGLVFTARATDRQKICALAEKMAKPLYRVGLTSKRRKVMVKTPNGQQRDVSYAGFEHSF